MDGWWGAGEYWKNREIFSGYFGDVDRVMVLVGCVDFLLFRGVGGKNLKDNNC